MTGRKTMKWAIIVLMALGFGGCATKKVPATHYYTIDTGTPDLQELVLQTPRFDALKIVMVHPTRLTNSSNIFYLDVNHRQQPYSYSRWYEPVNTLLENKLLLALKKANVAHTVLGSVSGSMADYRLEITVLEFIQDFTQGKPSKARVSLMATLLDNRSRDILATKLFETEIPAPSDNAEGGVAAFNEISDTIVREIIRWIESPETKSQR